MTTSYAAQPVDPAVGRIMTNRRVALLLLMTILVGLTLPLLAAFYFMDRALQTSLNLAFNTQVAQVLDDESRNLRRLRDVDPENRDTYRAQFDRVEELRLVYSNAAIVRNDVHDSLWTYFAIGMAGAVLLAALMAAFLSRRIARSYDATFRELVTQRERASYLEEMASWQELARMLAHEIRNPLTPIQVLVTSLKRAYHGQSAQQFAAQLDQTEAMVGEELRHLQNTVSKFSEFAKLPRVQLAVENLSQLLSRHMETVSGAFPSMRYRIESPPDVRAMVDAAVFRQVLVNIVRNGIEANPDRSVAFVIEVRQRRDNIVLEISNDGVPVAPEIAPRIFDPYVSSRSSQDNMGLGLAISRKIVIEHGGDIRYEERNGCPAFIIALPAMAG